MNVGKENIYIYIYINGYIGRTKSELKGLHKTLQVLEKDKRILKTRIGLRTGSYRLFELQRKIRESESKYIKLMKRMEKLQRSIKVQGGGLVKAKELKERIQFEIKEKGYSAPEADLISLINSQYNRNNNLTKKINFLQKGLKERDEHITHLKSKIYKLEEIIEKKKEANDVDIDGKRDYSNRCLTEIRQSHNELKISVQGEIEKARNMVLSHVDRREQAHSKYNITHKVYIYIYKYT